MIPRTLLLTLEYPPLRGGVGAYLHTLHDGMPNVSILIPKSSWPLWPRWLPIFFETFQEMRRTRTAALAVSHVLPMGYIALLARWFLGTPFFVFAHGLDVARAYRSPWKRWWVRTILRRARAIIANSDFTKGIVLKYGVQENRITIITPCVTNIHENIPENGLILSVGRLVARKNFESVLRAVAALRQEFSSLRLVIIGDGPLRETLLETIRALHIQDVVTMIPQATDAERDAWYRHASIFVLPTLSEGDDVEGFGIVFLEAASYGIPAIAGHGGGVAEAVIHGKTGLVINPRSHEELVDALRTLSGNADYARTLGEAARARILESFTCAARQNQLSTLYGKPS